MTELLVLTGNYARCTAQQRARAMMRGLLIIFLGTPLAIVFCLGLAVFIMTGELNPQVSHDMYRKIIFVATLFCFPCGAALVAGACADLLRRRDGT